MGDGGIVGEEGTYGKQSFGTQPHGEHTYIKVIFGT